MNIYQYTVWMAVSMGAFLLCASPAHAQPSKAPEHSMHSMDSQGSDDTTHSMHSMGSMHHAGADSEKEPAKGAVTSSSSPTKMQKMRFGQMNGTRPASDGMLPAESGTHDAMSHDAMSHEEMSHDAMSHDAMSHDAMSNMHMEASGHDAMGMSSMQRGKAPDNARSPDYSDGYEPSTMPGMEDMMPSPYGMLLLDRLEYGYGNAGHSGALNAEAWVGGDLYRLWLKAEGEFGAEGLENMRLEALWSHPLVAFVDLQIGLRQDLGEGPARTWATIGVEALLPWNFDLEAAVYATLDGRVAARLEIDYDWLLTQKLIVRPSVEFNFYSKDDPERGIGAGLSEFRAGLRLRYEIRREIAPYLGVAYIQHTGRTVRFARALGRPAWDVHVVAGIRMWY